MTIVGRGGAAVTGGGVVDMESGAVAAGEGGVTAVPKIYRGVEAMPVVIVRRGCPVVTGGCVEVMEEPALVRGGFGCGERLTNPRAGVEGQPQRTFHHLGFAL
ncbi:MAG: hypothetical protein BJ554DRAFT_3097, partial [Olpidium bornovanus]